MKLTNPTDDQLNAAFAERVAGWRCEMIAGAWSGDGVTPAPVWTSPGGQIVGTFYSVPRFTASADAVLPWLDTPFKDDRIWSVAICRSVFDCSWRVTIREGLKHSSDTPEFTGIATSMVRAAVIALLRANGVEVEFTAPPHPPRQTSQEE